MKLEFTFNLCLSWEKKKNELNPLGESYQMLKEDELCGLASLTSSS